MVRIDLPNELINVKCGVQYNLKFKVQVFSVTDLTCCFYLNESTDCYFLVPKEEGGGETKVFNICKQLKKIKPSDGEKNTSISIKIGCKTKNDSIGTKILGVATDERGREAKDIASILISC